VFETGAAAEAAPAPAPAAGRARAAAPAAAASKSEGPVASAVGDIRETLPGMSPQVARGAEYTADPAAGRAATRKLARELGVDLRRVEPSGSAGRVTREDVERSVNGAAAPAPAAAPAVEAKGPGARRAALAPSGGRASADSRPAQAHLREHGALQAHRGPLQTTSTKSTWPRLLRSRIAPSRTQRRRA